MGRMTAAAMMLSVLSMASTASAQDGNFNGRVETIICSAEQPFNGSIMDGIGSLVLHYETGTLIKPASAGAAGFGNCVGVKRNGRLTPIFNIGTYTHARKSVDLPGTQWHRVVDAKMTLIEVGRYGRSPHAGFRPYAQPLMRRGVVDVAAKKVKVTYDDRRAGDSVAVDLLIELTYPSLDVDRDD